MLQHGSAWSNMQPCARAMARTASARTVLPAPPLRRGPRAYSKWRHTSSHSSRWDCNVMTHTKAGDIPPCAATAGATGVRCAC